MLPVFFFLEPSVMWCLQFFTRCSLSCSCPWWSPTGPSLPCILCLVCCCFFIGRNTCTLKDAELGNIHGVQLGSLLSPHAFTQMQYCKNNSECDINMVSGLNEHVSPDWRTVNRCSKFQTWPFLFSPHFSCIIGAFLPSASHPSKQQMYWHFAPPPLPPLFTISTFVNKILLAVWWLHSLEDKQRPAVKSATYMVAATELLVTWRIHLGILRNMKQKKKN